MKQGIEKISNSQSKLEKKKIKNKINKITGSKCNQVIGFKTKKTLV